MNYCLLVSVVLLSIGAVVKAQDCQIKPVINNLAFPEFNSSAEFLAVIGRNTIDSVLAEELTEYYSGYREISVETSRTDGLRLKTFAYYLFKEVLILRGDKCVAYDLSTAEELGISPMSKELVNGKNISVSVIGLLVNKDLKFVDTGKNTIRGRPVNEWQACYKRDSDNATVKLIYSFYEKTPFQLKKIIQRSLTTVEISTITEFRLFNASYRMSTENWKEDDDFPPAGVFCEGKQQTYPIPKMPNAFSFEVEANSVENDKTSISTFKFEYNFDAKIFRADYPSEFGRNSEILDLNTGIKYNIEARGGTCEISRVTKDDIGISGDSKISIQDPQKFFQFDDTFVFSALRTRNGVATKVFSSNKPYKGNKAVWEWYFLDSAWKQEGITDIETPFPVAIEITFLDPETNKTYVQALNFNRFKKSDVVLLDHDISKCGSGINKRHFSIAINQPEFNRKIKDNLYKFLIAAQNAIMDKAKVTLMRISNLDISFDYNVVFIVFTLFERNAFYGEVDIPKYDYLLDDAVNNLMNSIHSGNMNIDMITSDNETVSLMVSKESFKEIPDRNERFITLNKPVDKEGTSGGLTAFLTILATVVGIALAILIVYLHKKRTITVPYMKNFETES